VCCDIAASVAQQCLASLQRYACTPEPPPKAVAQVVNALQNAGLNRAIRKDVRFETMPITTMAANALAGDRDKALFVGIYVEAWFCQARGPLIESRRADSIVDVVLISPRSIPSSAIVWAIAGEIPEIMVLHPINTAAFAILIR